MEVNSLYFIIKVKLPARTWHQQEKKNEYKICYALGQNLPQWFKPILLLPGNGQNYEKKVFTKEKYTEIGATLSTPQRTSGSVTKTCGLLNT